MEELNSPREPCVVALSGDRVGPAALLRLPSSSIRRERPGPAVLFGCPEGLSRLVLEHKLRLSNCLQAVLLDQPAHGFPGLLLRLAADGHAALALWGPRGVPGRLEAATRQLVGWNHPTVRCIEGAAPAETGWCQGRLEVWPVPIPPPRDPQAAPSSSSSDTCDELSPASDSDSPRAKRPRLGRVEPGGVLAGWVCWVAGLKHPLVVLSCHSDGQLQAVIEDTRLTQLLTTAHLVLHLSPAHMLARPAYQQWLARSPEPHHVLLAHSAGPSHPSAARYAAALAQAAPDNFAPMQPLASSPDAVPLLQRWSLQPAGIAAHSEACPEWPETSSSVQQPTPHLAPEDRANLIRAAELRARVGCRPQPGPGPPWLDRCDSEVLFLGTGCAEPSKHRAPSGILINRTVLLDAGEGTLGQIGRRYGPEAWRVVAGLLVVWISHRHGDHVLGLPSLIEAHRAATEWPAGWWASEWWAGTDDICLWWGRTALGNG